ncbi:PREDICTED: centromere-associated protein E-like [Polistes dominula]|uniref:Centromere-associated protein E-like n=1 Tax=Polistes dominula TaxID=743375 RepID=A0ABM1IIE1_POLDO|nr:PREDICTED: centromere-associated protein E-like [Polistes dominula]
MSDSIKVAIKVRPLIKREKEENLPKQWIVQGNYIASTDQEMRKRGDGGFNFDHIFDETTSNKDVFDTVVKPIVDAAVNGFNGTVIAYGQTSSGKTYTMMGGLNEPGIIMLAIEHMFDAIANTLRREFLLRVSYLEIYNEKVNDLLNKSVTDLKLHEDNGQIVIKCKEEVTNSPEHVLSIMKKGNKNRRIEETDMNERSSRSHTIFRITIESRKTDAESDGAIQVSQLNLADFAGSERAGQAGTTGERFKEGRLINLSLSAFGLVIKQLSESQDTQKHVNFRDSKLTRLLQNSIGGNAKTAIICTITPAALEESQYTLSFASRAKRVENKPQVNEVMSDATLLKRYAKQISKLNCELEKIKKEKTEELESRLHEKDRINQLLEERIELLKTKIVSGNNANNEDTFGCRSKRRRTWAGPTFKQNVSNFQPSQGLPTIKEMSPVKPCRKSIIQSVDLMDQSFQIAFTDFELELINDEKDRDDDDSIDSVKEMYITKNRHQHRVTFMDDLSIYKPNYNIYESTPIKRDITPSQANDIQEDQSFTPKKVLRERLSYLQEEFDKLCEFTTLEKQLYIENHQCNSVNEKQVTTEQNSELQEQILNVTTENNLLKNLISEVLKYATSPTNINAESIEMDLLDETTSQMSSKTILDIPFKDIEVKQVIDKLQNKIMKSIKQHEIRNLEKIFESDIQMSHLKSENKELKEQIISLKQEIDEQNEKEQMYESEFEQNLSCKENPLTLISDIKEESSIIKKKSMLLTDTEEANVEFERSILKSKEIENILEQGKQLIEFSPIKPRRSLEQLNSTNKTCKHEISSVLIKETLNDNSHKMSTDVQRKRSSILEEKENIIVEMNEEYKNVSVNEQIDHVDVENLFVKLRNHLDNIDKCEIVQLHQLNEIFVSKDQQYVLSELNKQKIENDYNNIRNVINDSVHLKSLLHDLDTFVNSIMTKNNKMKEQLEKQLNFLTESFNDNVDNEELVADLDMKTQELSEIKSDVVSLKLDMKKLQRTIFLLTAENEELSAKLSAEKISKADCSKMIDDLQEQISKMNNENKDMLNEILILNEQIKCFQLEGEDTKENKCLNYDKTISNIEVSNDNNEKPVNVDCKTEQIELQTSINETTIHEGKMMKDDTSSFVDEFLTENELKSSQKKCELMKLKEKVTLLTEEHVISLKKSLETLDNKCDVTLNVTSEETKDDKLNILLTKCTTLKETMDYLVILNTKLADMKIILCNRCAEMKELNENKKDIKLKTKMLTVKLENMQENFNRKCANIELLKNKANEDSFLNISETSFDGSSLDGINVTSVEEEVSLLNKEMQILQDDHVKLSYLYKEKCDETERLRNSIITETNVVSPYKKDTKKGKSKIDKLQKDIDYCKVDLQELKNKIINDLKKSLNEINMLKSANDELSKIISNQNVLLETSEKNAKLFENEMTNLNVQIDNYKMVQEQVENEKSNLKQEIDNMKINIQVKEDIVNDLNRIIDEYKEKNDCLEKKLENIEESIEMSRQIYEDKYEIHNTLNNEIDKLKDDLNSAKACIINEMKCLKPIEDSQNYFDKSINNLLLIFLEMVTSKEQEVINVIQERLSIDKEKYENERQQSILAEKCLRLRTEELELEVEKLKDDIKTQEIKHLELLNKMSLMEHTLKENNNEKEILMKKIQSLQIDYNNMQEEFNKQSAIKIQQREIDINKKEEMVETIRIREEYKDKIDNLLSTLEKYKINNVELMKNVESLENNEKDLKNILNMRTDELDKCNKNLEKINNDIEQLTNINDELKREMENKDAHILEITNLLQNKSDMLHEYKIELESLRINDEKHLENVEDLKEKLNLKIIKYEELNKQCIELKNQNVILFKELDSLKEQYIQLEEKNMKLEQKLRNSNSRIKLETDMEELLEQNKALQNNLDGAYNCIAELKDKKKHLLEEYLSTKERYESLLDENKQMIKEILLNKEKDIKSINDQCEELKGKNQQLEEENKTLKKDNEDLNEEIEVVIKENDVLTEKVYSYFGDDNPKMLKAEINTLKEENQKLQDKLTKCSNCGILLSKDQLKCNKDNNNDELANLKKQIKELEFELVSKNGRIATLQLQIQGGSFPYQEKCKDLEENLLAFKNKNIQLESEIKKLRHAMCEIDMKECYKCKNQFINQKSQYVQTIPISKIQFCGTSSGIVENHVQIEKLEKEKAFMKQLCRSRCKKIKELEKKLMELQNIEDLSAKTNIYPEDRSCATPKY